MILSALMGRNGHKDLGNAHSVQSVPVSLLLAQHITQSQLTLLSSGGVLQLREQIIPHT